MTENVSHLYQAIINRLFQRPEPGDGYRVYTRKYDTTTNADDLDSLFGRAEAGTLAAIEEAWQAFTATLGPWKIRVAASALGSADRVRTALALEERQDIVVSLLIDLSGSMRGQKILLAAAAADCAQDYLGGLGARSEILGFTTRTWRGGRPRRDWLLSGMIKQPGRLNELLHIVFKSADDSRRSTENWSLRQMFRPHLLKENIDGEALEWAIERLRAAPFGRKILLVISDGAPVDDATLQANGLKYLDEHLRSVIKATTEAGDVELAALGVGYAVSRYYSRNAEVDTPEDLGDRLIELLEQLLIGA